MTLRISSLTHPRRAHAKLAIAAVFVLGALAGATLGPGRNWTGILRPAPAALPSSVQSAPAEVLRVYDGDTFEARVRLGPGQVIHTKVRLRGIDTPERDARCAEEAAMAETARRALMKILAEGQVRVSQIGADKYGRMLAAVATQATPDVAAALLRLGVGRPYDGGYRAGWCDKPRRDWRGAGLAR
jgi:micrococcal nuclease